MDLNEISNTALSYYYSLPQIIMTSEFVYIRVRLLLWQGDQAVAYPPKSLRRGQRWPIWAQTSRLVQNDCLHKYL